MLGLACLDLMRSPDSVRCPQLFRRCHDKVHKYMFRRMHTHVHICASPPHDAPHVAELTQDTNARCMRFIVFSKHPLMLDFLHIQNLHLAAFDVRDLRHFPQSTS